MALLAKLAALALLGDSALLADGVGAVLPETVARPAVHLVELQLVEGLELLQRQAVGAASGQRVHCLLACLKTQVLAVPPLLPLLVVGLQGVGVLRGGSKVDSLSRLSELTSVREKTMTPTITTTVSTHTTTVAAIARLWLTNQATRAPASGRPTM